MSEIECSSLWICYVANQRNRLYVKAAQHLDKGRKSYTSASEEEQTEQHQACNFKNILGDTFLDKFIVFLLICALNESQI